MDESFGPARRVRRRPEFTEAYDRGRKIHGRFVIAFALATGRDRTRLGLAVTRKVGSAVGRNLVKRRLREIFRRLPLRGGFDVVIVAKRECANAPWPALEQDIRQTLGRAVSAPAGRTASERRV